MGLILTDCTVAPLVGAWIEIDKHIVIGEVMHVAPLVGAWIEIVWTLHCCCWHKSLLSWERGLKCLVEHVYGFVFRRSSRGSVD